MTSGNKNESTKFEADVAPPLNLEESLRATELRKKRELVSQGETRFTKTEIREARKLGLLTLGEYLKFMIAANDE